MQLNDLKPAWKQVKLRSTMHPLETCEILSIIEHPESTDSARLQRVLYTVFMFMVIVIFCQGG